MLTDIDPKIRTFLVAAVSLSTLFWDLAFELGAFGVIFFEKVFLAWVTASAVLLGLFFLRERSPVKGPGLVVLSIPTLWMLLIIIDDRATPDQALDLASFGLALFIYLICLPYTIYVVVSILNPELIDLSESKLNVALVSIVLIIGLIGFLVGRNNALFLACDDFQVSGNDLPANCVWSK